MRHLIFTIIIILNNEKIFERIDKKIEIQFKSKNNIKSGIKTQIFYTLVDYNSNLINNRIDFGIFFEKPEIKIIKNTYFLGGSHYYFFNKIFKSNLKSNKIFNLSDKDIINKLSSLKYSIDYNFYNKVYNLICKNLELEVNENSLENFLKKNLKNIYNKKLFDEIENKKTNEEIENEKQIFQKKYSKLLEYYLFIEIKKLKNIKDFYLALQFDFRGRLYPKSCISPNGNKIIRLLYFYGYYSEKEMFLSAVKDINNEQKKLLETCLLIKIFNKINLNNKYNIYYFYICIFEIGKIFKNELSLKKNGIFNDLDVLNFAIEVINEIYENRRKLNFEEELEYIYIFTALEDLNKGLYKKLIIYKDATASGIQLLTVAHGSINDEILKYCNLRSYDL